MFLFLELLFFLELFFHDNVRQNRYLRLRNFYACFSSHRFIQFAYHETKLLFREYRFPLAASAVKMYFQKIQRARLYDRRLLN